MDNLESYLNHHHCDDDLKDILTNIAKISVMIKDIVSNMSTHQQLVKKTGLESAGDQQIALDVHCHNLFLNHLQNTSVKYFASEENDTIETINHHGQYALAIDPIDGSSNVSCNITIGSIFSVKPVLNTAHDSITQAGKYQKAACCISYGAQMIMMLTIGYGTALLYYDAEQQDYIIMDKNCTINDYNEYAINGSNQRYWQPHIAQFIHDCQQGKDGVLQENYNTRWVASLIAELQRILMRGGIFLYPSDSRQGYEHGRLRLLYEAHPVAMLIENAGGIATNGHDNILDITGHELHQRVPFIFGSQKQMQIFNNYCKNA